MADCGTYAGYRAGCDCQECDDAQYRYYKQYHYDQAKGIRRTIDPGPVTEHLRKLHDAGWSDDQIASSCGAESEAVAKHRLGRHEVIYQAMANLILSAKPTIFNVPPKSLVSAIGPARRLKALAAVGHSTEALAEEMNLNRATLHHLRSVPRTKARTACVIAETYRRLFWVVGPSDVARRSAERKGWAPPLAWDDIDNPGEVPNLGRKAPRYVALTEDWIQLKRQGYKREHAAERLGISRDGLDAAIGYYQEQHGPINA